MIRLRVLFALPRQHIEKNIKDVQNGIALAVADCGRDAESVKLIAVTKTYGADDINTAIDAGITDIGENRVQEILEKFDKVKPVRWHLIGHLQKNKVKYIIDKVEMIHSVDSEKLAAEIDKRSRAVGRVMDILVEINSGREENKSGVMPEDAAILCEKLSKYPNIRLCGFMTMAPRCESSAEYRKYFSETYDLIIDIWEKKLHNIKRPIISMGMSESFHEAVAEGSTCVRVGRAFFAK